MEDTGIKEVVSPNRNGDKIKVVRISLNEFILTGYSPVFFRTSRSNENRTIMFDPSGGPYTTAKYGDQPGTDMGYYHEDWKDLVVEAIDIQEDGGIKLTCSYDGKITWEQIEG
jgi:hypothetical protein